MGYSGELVFRRTFVPEPLKYDNDLRKGKSHKFDTKLSPTGACPAHKFINLE